MGVTHNSIVGQESGHHREGGDKDQNDSRMSLMKKYLFMIIVSVRVS